MRHPDRIDHSIDIPLPLEPFERASHPVATARRPVSTNGRALAHRAIAGAVAIAAAGCATHDTNPAQEFRIEPVFSVTHSVQSAASSQAYYTLGKYFDGLQEWGRAVDAYRQAVSADTGNVEACNALGVALAQGRHYAEAEATLRHAVALAPERTHIRNNLGYVLLLEGRPAEAMRELKTAIAQDGSSAIARANLREAMTRAGVRADDAVTAIASDDGKPAAAPSPNAPEPSSTAAVRALTDDARAEPVVGDPAPVRETPGVTASTLAARDASGGAAGTTPETGTSAAGTASPLRTLRLEVSNGNGVNGMAMHVGLWLAARGMTTDRLTNQQPFVQQQTVIQYRSGHEDAARRLATLLPANATTQALSTANLRSDIRVVLGRDWVPLAACLASTACSPAASVATGPAAITVAMAPLGELDAPSAQVTLNRSANGR